MQVSVANSISTTGIELSRYQERIQAYQRENARLRERYLKEASLTNIDQKAEKEGFISGQSALTLTAPLPLALK